MIKKATTALLATSLLTPLQGLASSPQGVSEAFCAEVRVYAKGIMEIRQRGDDMDTLKKSVSLTGDDEWLLFPIIHHAYERSIRHTEEGKRRAAEDFQTTLYRDCRKQITP